MSGTQRGRPRASSRRSLADAAGELFLEQGYERTTVEDIARRAGVGRATFFNYVPSKADLLWVGVDEALDLLEEGLREAPVAGGVGSVLGVLEDVGGGLGPDRIPLAVTQLQIIGGGAEVASAGYARVARLAAMLQLAVATAVPHGDPVLRSSAASSVAAVTVSAWHSWAAAGVGRGPLAPYLGRALSVVREGLGASLP